MLSKAMSSKPTPRPESIELIGGHTALDLVNTVSWRQNSSRWRENLAQPADLLTWCRRAGVIDHRAHAALNLAMADDREAAEHSLRTVRDLREHLHDHLAARIDHPEADHSIRRDDPLHRAFADAMSGSDLVATPARWHLDVRTPGDIPRHLALHALNLVQSSPLQRLRRCDDGDGCGWLFLDTTRNHSRRWCSSSDCGNRDRARRHYARTHKTNPSSRPAQHGEERGRART
jgi:predicted RNA-binding Zn ribbon-like protein